jgi:acyl dehydratase
MPIDLDSLGYETSAITYAYTWKDTVLYALGVGATPDRELDFLYEGRGPKVVPTYCTIPTFVAFDELVDRIGCDRSGMVHHSQEARVYKPLRPNDTLEVRGRVDGLYDLKRVAMAVFVIDAYDGDGDLAVRGEVTLALLRDGRFDGPRPPKAERVSLPDRAADFESVERIPETGALLYRLNGDLNPLHADPAFAEKVGFERPILHGLCTFGYAGRALVRHACGGDPDRFHSLRAQFSSPVFPGDTLVVRGWHDDQRVLLSASTEERPNEPCLTQAWASIR